jgi:hypothetical protein
VLPPFPALTTTSLSDAQHSKRCTSIATRCVVCIERPLVFWRFVGSFISQREYSSRTSYPQTIKMAPAKPVLHPLKTPKSTTFPSEINSASLSSLSDTKPADAMSTPITPPLAYTEFLKALTPVFTSPVSPDVAFSKFPMDNRPTSTSQPSTATSGSFSSGKVIKSATFSPQSPNVPLHSAKGASGRRRMKISPIKTSAKAFSPITDSPKSASTLRSPFSPADWKLRYFEAPRSSKGKPVSVRQVVTRTVTYKRTPLDPPPKGKRRKTSEP